jgi:hypothetical protein
MTVYVSDTPYGDRFFLWADTTDEAQGIAYAVGMDPVVRSEWHNAWECYLLTPDQFADACTLGVTVTDRSGPALWCARRDGRTSMVEKILAAQTARLHAGRE